MSRSKWLNTVVLDVTRVSLQNAKVANATKRENKSNVVAVVNAAVLLN